MQRIIQINLLLLLSVLFVWNALAAPVAMVSNIEVEGLKRTEEVTVLRELPFAVGAIWQDDFSEHAERRLRSLGIFSEVLVAAPDENGSVQVRVKERWSLWVLPQANRKDNGVTSASLVVDEYNLWGLNHHARLGYTRNTGKNFSGVSGATYAASYDWRRVADSKLGISVSGNWGSSVFDAYNLGVHAAQYRQTGKSASVLLNYALGDVPGEGWSITGGFTGSNATYQFLSGAPQANVVGNRMRAIVTGLSYSLIDDRITWLSGSAFSYSGSLAHKGLGSTVNVYSHTASWRNYYAFSGQHTLNIRLNGGLITGDVLRSGVFDIGNRDGLRGYYPGELQGTNYLYGTLEGRFPIRQSSNFQVVAFTDIGKIGGRVGSSVTRGLAIGSGGGFRWTMRWLVKGTLRGDVAYGFASKRWRFYLGSGQAF